MLKGNLQYLLQWQALQWKSKVTEDNNDKLWAKIILLRILSRDGQVCYAIVGIVLWH